MKYLTTKQAAAVERHLKRKGRKKIGYSECVLIGGFSKKFTGTKHAKSGSIKVCRDLSGKYYSAPKGYK